METSEEETVHICYFISGTGHKSSNDIYKFSFLPPILYSPFAFNQPVSVFYQVR